MSLRLARAFTGREKIVKFEGAYHGNHDYAMWSYRRGRPSALPRARAPRPTASRRCIAEHGPRRPLQRPRDHRAGAPRRGRRGGGGHRGARAAPHGAAPGVPGEPSRPRRRAWLRPHLRRDGDRLPATPSGALRSASGWSRTSRSTGRASGAGSPSRRSTGREDILSLCDPRRAGEPNAVYFSGTGFGNPVACAAGRAMLAALRLPRDLRALLRPLRAPEGRPARDCPAPGRRGPGDRRGADVAPRLSPRSRSTTTGRRSRRTGRGSCVCTTGSSTPVIFVRPGGGHYFSMAHTDRDVDATLDAVDRILARMN